jgi:hypothetical protein
LGKFNLPKHPKSKYTIFAFFSKGPFIVPDESEQILCKHGKLRKKWIKGLEQRKMPIKFHSILDTEGEKVRLVNTWEDCI